MKRQLFLLLQDKSTNKDLLFFYHIAGKTSFDRLEVDKTFNGIKFQGILKFFLVFIIFIVLYFLSIIIGLFTRLFYVFVMTVFSIVGGKCFSKQLSTPASFSNWMMSSSDRSISVQSARHSIHGLNGLPANTLADSDFFGRSVASPGDLDGDGV